MAMNQGQSQSDFILEVAGCFEPGGALSKATVDFVSRDSQRAFAITVAEAIESTGTVVVEAGTGTGKTFAYLTPALLSGVKVIVSTAGKPLQDQLFSKDLPAVERALGSHAEVALLKGRSNYVCKHRLASCVRDGLLPTPQSVNDLRLIRIFAQTSTTGDKSEIEGVAEDAPIWPLVTSTRDNCIGSKCSYASECFVNRARALAKQADVVVVNHHLYLSAVAVSQEAVGEDADMLPQAGLVVFDEAHKLPEIASDFFGSEFSTYSLKEVAKEIKRVTMSRHKRFAPPDTSWDALCDAVVHALLDFILDLDALGVHEGDNAMVSSVENIATMVPKVERVVGAAKALAEPIRPLSEDDADLGALLGSLEAMAADLMLWRQVFAAPLQVRKDSNGVPSVCWISRSINEAKLHETPIRFAQNFARIRDDQPSTAWVFASATLATEGNDFSHFLSEMGLQDALTFSWPSPFDFSEQAMLYVPQNMPSARSNDREIYIESLIRESWPIIDMLEGRTFVLCTSYRAMRHAGEILRAYVENNGRDYAVYVQGEDTRTQLLKNFRNRGRSILVATMGFWEGIDIKGDALSLVIIDKLPFAPQNDPVMEARCRWIEEQGGNAFQDHQIPLAAIALKQGTGRLIRSESDRGILIIGDERVIPNRSRYGARFLNSLPPYSRTRHLKRVIDFWCNPHAWS